ncbi:hypothetical protein AVEN_19596-1 [Araneus ventricosus]|uniref:Uncharacterized protein n=1 Tax=Araneus ventricosus TaxID=182803 RepID=A0A4Y2KVD8_ARAVE|nr:hypothetical protein AVEN_19596-1 [Araneus ventricosus]
MTECELFDGPSLIWDSDPTCQQETVQSGRASVVVWGVCSRLDMRSLIRLETTLAGTGTRTVRHPTRQELLPSGSRNSSDFRHFHWPPRSPDMNIIEPICVALQCDVQKKSPPPRTPMDLRTAL